jgi:hypothetical protein
MCSLLREELNNYNNNLGKNSIDKKTNLINDKIEKKLINSEYIKNEKNEKSENSLNIHIFNPLKNSPPSNWQFRLLNRINSLNDLENIN